MSPLPLKRQFPYEATHIAGYGHRFRFPVRCCKCGTEKVFEASKALPDQVVSKKFKSWGWLIGRNRAYDICPRCLGVSFENKLAERFKVTKDDVPVPTRAEVVAKAATKRDSLERQVKDSLFADKLMKTVVDELSALRASIDRLVDTLSGLKLTAAKTSKKSKNTANSRRKTPPANKTDGVGI